MPKQPQAQRSHLLDRRSAIKSAGGIVAAGYFTSSAVARSQSANEKLNLACIGTANRAAADIDGVRHEAVVALCDVDSNNMERKLKEFPDAKSFVDYREMIDQLGDSVDAVVVGVGDVQGVGTGQE